MMVGVVMVIVFEGIWECIGVGFWIVLIIVLECIDEWVGGFDSKFFNDVEILC